MIRKSPWSGEHRKCGPKYSRLYEKGINNFILNICITWLLLKLTVKNFLSILISLGLIPGEEKFSFFKNYNDLVSNNCFFKINPLILLLI